MKAREPQLIYGESCIFARGNEARLLFEPVSILKVYNSNSGAVYQAGIDYTVDLPNRTLVRTEQSRIPVLSEEDLYPSRNIVYLPAPNANALKGGPDGKHLRFDAKLFFAKHQIEVDYLAIPGWPAVTTGKLRHDKIARFTTVGDSITDGFNASAFIGEAPYQKPYPGLVADALGAKLTNLGVNGASVMLLREIHDDIVASKPDLLSIAFGMNDISSLKPEEFIQEIRTAVDKLRVALPELDILVVAAMSGNPEWYHTPVDKSAAFADALSQYAREENLLFADVHKVWAFALERKDFYSLTGNGVNHPNDFGHRLYAQTILKVIGR